MSDHFEPRIRAQAASLACTPTRRFQNDDALAKQGAVTAMDRSRGVRAGAFIFELDRAMTFLVPPVGIDVAKGIEAAREIGLDSGGPAVMEP
ncbi:MAG TPA: hypothetical protein VHK24_10210 [Steroidobacter sp.]|jgi:hypothetical protein|nr:hypothetical protein [Steroidobacter sp.]